MPNGEATEAESKRLFHRRPACAAAVGLLCGLLLYDALPADAWGWAAGLLAAASAAAFLCRRRMAALVLLLIAVGISRAALAALPDAPAQSGRLQGRVCSDRTATYAGGYRVDVAEVSIDGAPLPGKLRLYVSGGRLLAYGQTVDAAVEVTPPKEAERSYYRYAGVTGAAYAVGAIDATDGGGLLPGLKRRLYGWRADVKARILTLFPENGGVAAAMLLGDKAAVDRETREGFENAGLLHLMAVSGLHVSILAGAASALVRRGRWRRFVFSALFLTAYAFLTAFSPSVLRAGILFLTVQLAFPLRRRPDPPSALAAAFVGILLGNPNALYYVGFQLSFLAALSMALLSPMLTQRLRFLGGKLAGVLGGTVAASVGTLPAIALYFGAFMPASLVANILVLPLVPWFLVPAFLAVALSYLLPPVGAAAAFLARFPLAAITAIAKGSTAGAVALPAPNLAAYLLYVTAMVFASRLLLGGRRRRVLFSVGALSLSLLCWALF